MQSNLLKCLDNHALFKKETPAYIFLNASGTEEQTISFGKLHEKALHVASVLSSRNVAKKRIILSFPPGIEFIISFLGCLYAGATAVPLPLPKSKRQKARSLPTIDNAQPSLILTKDPEINFQIPSISLDDIFASSSSSELPPIHEEDIALLQYTSGSTSSPKGVIITHRHLLHHQKVLTQAFEHSQETKIVGWLPFYHDMGLIGNILQPIYLGVTAVLMAPLTFIQRPIHWLNAISTYRATTSGGPNFAYQYCISKISESELSSLDLSSWSIAFNGSERIHAETLNQFAHKFASVGFQASSFFPCYGLAESTLFVTGRKTTLSLPFTTQEGNTSTVVCCGKPISSGSIAIVDPQTKTQVPDGISGEVWFQEPSVAKGYWNNPQETKNTFEAYTCLGSGPYLRTGDIGFLKDEDLYILGRLKNIIIIRGKNYFPEDIESCVQRSHPLLNNSQGCSFEIENLIIVQEIDRTIKDPSVVNELFTAIKKSLSDEYELTPSAIIFVSPNSLPRTTSGKLQNYLIRKQFIEKSLFSLFSWEQEETPSPTLCDDTKEGLTLKTLAHLLKIPIDTISPDEPIIHFGLDSITGTQFAGWLQEQFNIKIDSSFLLNGATLQNIYDLQKKEPFCENQDTKKSISSDCLDKYILSFNQLEVWTFLQLNPLSSSYNIPFAIRIKGKINPAELKRALAVLISRHTSLRTQFGTEFSTPFQVVLPSVEPPLSIYDVTNEAEASHTIHEEMNLPFDLSKAPLFSISLIRVADQNEEVLVFRFHHLICDGWSIHLFMRELEAAYENKDLEPRHMNYTTFVKWQETEPSEGRSKELLFEDEYSVLRISPFAPSETSSGSITTSIHEQLFSKIKNFASNHKVTLSLVLMTAFHSLLHLYSGEETVFVGYPVMNRPLPDFQKTIGFFVNTAVCKTKKTKKTTFNDLLMQVKEMVWQGPKEMAYPFHKLLKLLQPPRFPDKTPLFQAMFVMQNAPVSLKNFCSLEIEILHLPPQHTPYDLVLEVHEHKKHADLIFEYQQKKIPKLFAEELKNQFLHMLNSLETESCTPSFVQGPKLAIPQSCTVLDLFEQSAAHHPEKIAIFSDQGNFTYKELSNSVDSIAKLLIEQNISLGEPVGISLEREPLLIASILGIIKAGGCYVPIDSSYPPKRIQSIIEDSQLRYIISKNSFSSKVISIDPSTPLKAKKSSFPLIPQNSPAYLLYTSGSSGKPKGVQVLHKSLLNFVLSAIPSFNMKNSDRVLQFSSISWDTASEEIYPCLTTGGSLVLRSNSRIESFDDLLKRTKKYEVTMWDLPSSYWHDLVDMIHTKKISLPPSLRLVIVGGEKVYKSKVDLWFSMIDPQVTLLNTYGATEATSISAIFNLSKWKDEWTDVPIGRPIHNISLYILNQSLESLPPGAPGVLYIGGAGVSQGYIHLPELTQEKFIIHPQTGERIYCTGDIAYFSLTGEALVCGRADRQVKRRGFRIELEEIEKVILSSGLDVESCVVLLDKHITAYVVSKEPILSHTFKDMLRTILPDYLLPDQIVFVPTIFRLPSGKIDTVSLKNFTSPIQTTKNESYTPEENSILAIWKELLSIDSIQREDNFFDIGGNSLLLLQLHEKLQNTFSVKINVSLLFSHFTIASQAKIIVPKKNTSSKLDIFTQLEKGLITPEQAKKSLNINSRN